MRDDLDWIPIKKRLPYNVLFLVHKLLNNQLPIIKNICFMKINIPSYETGNVNEIRLPHMYKIEFEKPLLKAAWKIYNEMPESLKK